MKVLILHLEAPLMSFGGPQVDQIGPTRLFPTLSQVTGLIANALGYTHRNVGGLQDLQDRLCLASALVREGSDLLDYQTVDLGQPHLRSPAWTTYGLTEHRFGGPDARYGTHIRFRHYRADASILTAVSLSPAGLTPTLGSVCDALLRPARPLVIGRKACLPSTQLVVGLLEDAESLTHAIQRVPSEFPERWREIAPSFTGTNELAAEWPADGQDVLPSAGTAIEFHRVVDRRDWRNQLHGGERVVARGSLTVCAVEDPST
ncbi:MAG: type I-E CRISPR-associated protein Cas5/CasD [Bryobacterales bacterium]|nr:type I-E CRISPR-associated protein Cas5/CasD [Bryobacterales bacterium]